MKFENVFAALDKQLKDMDLDISIKTIRIQLLEAEVKKLKEELKCAPPPSRTSNTITREQFFAE